MSFLSNTEFAEYKLKDEIKWNAIGLLVFAISGISINIFISFFLGATALGYFNILFAFFILLPHISVCGIHYSVLKQISHNPNNLEYCKSHISNALLIVTFISTLFSFLILFSRDSVESFLQVESLSSGLLVLTPATLFFAINKVQLNIVNGFNNMRAYAVFNALRMLVMLFLVLIIIYKEYELYFLSFSFLFTEIFMFFSLSIYNQINLVLFSPYYFSYKIIIENLEFGLKGFLSGLIVDANTRVDILVLSVFVSTSFVGIYSFVSMIAEGIGQISYTLRRIIDPKLGYFLSDKKHEMIEKLAAGTKKTFFPTMIILGISIVVFYPLLVKYIIDNSEFNAGYWALIILVTGYVLNSLYRPLLGIFLQSDHPGKYTYFIGLLLILNIIANIILVPIYGINGAAIATFFVLVLEALGVYLFSRFYLKINL